MARITVEDCLGQIGEENRFALIHLAVTRLRQHRNGQPFILQGKNKEVVMTLREIAAGRVTFENIRQLGEMELPPVATPAPLQPAETSEGE